MNIVEFEFETEYGLFHDAIIYPDDVFYTEEELDLIKQNRLNDWLLVVTPTDPPARPLTETN